MTKRYQVPFWLALYLCFGLSVGCQLVPTKVKQSEQREFDLVVSKSTKPLVLTEKTVVLDARPSFDYGLNRVTGSHHFRFENLAEPGGEQLLKDRRRLAQRLALLGLTPETPIVVVGNGPSGDGSEGRLAWTLLYLGFRDVQTASIDVFRGNLTQVVTPVPKNAAPVDVEGNVAMVTRKDDFDRLVANAKERSENRIWIVDVGGATKEKPDPGALALDWKQFYTKQGRPDPLLRKKMRDLGVSESDRIILTGGKSGASSAAAYSLISLGFNRVENFTR